MRERGRIAAVEERRIGDVLALDSLAGATSITLEDAEPFAERGGKLKIGNEAVSYNAFSDPGTGDVAIPLASALVKAYAAGDPVHVEPAAYERVAHVRLDDQATEVVLARVPRSLWDRLPLGIRDEIAGFPEVVRIDHDGLEWVVADAQGGRPGLDLSFGLPETLGPEVPAQRGQYNLLEDPSFEVDQGGWYGDEDSRRRIVHGDSAGAFRGNSYLLFEGAMVAGEGRIYNRQLIDVYENDILLAILRARHTVSAGGSVLFGLVYYDVAGGILTAGGNGLGPGTTWAEATAFFEVPAGAYRARPFLEAGGAIASGHAIAVDLPEVILIPPGVSKEFSGARVYKTANEATAHAVAENLAFGAEAFDTAGYHSTVSQSERLKAPWAGRYRVSAQIAFAFNAAGRRRVKIMRSGTIQEAFANIAPPSSGQATVYVSTILDCNTGDYFEVEVFQNSGGALDVEGDAAGSATFFEMEYLGARPGL